jgi:N6-L-threonylcarbamoyladenine synthase
LKDNKLILGIETSCDDTSVAIIKDGAKPEILSHLKFGQEDILKHWGGVVPEIAARNHLEKITPLLDDVFVKSNVAPEDIDLISVTTVPGLLGPLLTGLNAAKTLSLILRKPVYPANHLYAHLEAIHLTENISYPYLGLLVSGGHSIYFWVENKTTFNVLGSTIDDASGEAFDKGGKMLNLGYPAGHIVDHLGQFGDVSKYQFPIGMKSSADARLSFSGLKTSLRVFLEKNPDILSKCPSQFETKEDASQDFYDVCASYQNAIAKALVLKMRYAIKIAKEKYQSPNSYSIVVGGGVACNSEIRKQFKEKYNKVSFVAPQFCTDNGAMIANLGRINFDSALPYPDSLRLDARGRFINKEEYK